MNQYLTESQVEELISNNLYPKEGYNYQSRCFSSDYGNNPNLPLVSIPGGDIGELAIFMSAALTYGFTINWDTFMDVFLVLIKGNENSTFNANKQHTPELCHYVNYVFNAPSDYGLDNEAKKRLVKLGKTLGLSGNFKPSRKDNPENACIIFEAEYGLFPKYLYDSDHGVLNANILIFHKTYVDRRHMMLCKLLVENKAVTLFPGLDSDYLYEIISEITETHLFETLKKRDPRLPLFYVSVSPEKKISVKAY